jgi:hypothetical protein
MAVLSKYQGMSNEELATLIADRWLKTSPNATQGYRWKQIKDEALEVINHVESSAFIAGMDAGAT